MTATTHQIIRQSILTRIQSGEWPLGELIPGETALATEYGCARTTVNRALRGLAEEGLVVRKRKGGTRVCALPSQRAKFEISVIREQVEAEGGRYAHKTIKRRLTNLPASIGASLGVTPIAKVMQLDTLHFADGHPYAFEKRWVNLQAVPAISDAPLDTVSANEWLLKTVPFSTGEVAFSAVNAKEAVASALNIDIGAAIFVIDRTTWLEDEFITTVKLYYRKGFSLRSQL